MMCAYDVCMYICIQPDLKRIYMFKIEWVLYNILYRCCQNAYFLCIFNSFSVLLELAWKIAGWRRAQTLHRRRWQTCDAFLEQQSFEITRGGKRFVPGWDKERLVQYKPIRHDGEKSTTEKSKNKKTSTGSTEKSENKKTSTRFKKNRKIQKLSYV